MKKQTDQKTGSPADAGEKKSPSGKSARIRNILMYSASMVFVILAAGTILFYNQDRYKEEFNDLKIANDYLHENIFERDSIINQWIQTMIKIEEDLIAMQEKESFLLNTSSSGELSLDLHNRVEFEIQQLNKLLEDNKMKIKSLNSKLKNSGIRIAALEKKAAMLEASLVSRDSSISELKVQLADREIRVSELNTRVNHLNSKVEETMDQLTMQNNLMNKAFIMKGNLRDLEEKGLVTREGGLFGIGGKLRLMADFNDDQFTKVDISEFGQIELNARKARLITDHPLNSYEIVSNDSLITYLEIKDPGEFWKISRYAVVETKK